MFILLVWLGALPICAQRASISGQTVESESGAALVKATIQLYKLSERKQKEDTTFVTGALSDDHGNFCFRQRN